MKYTRWSSRAACCESMVDRTNPENLVIMSNLDRSSTVRAGEELPIEILSRYLSTRLTELHGPLNIEQFPAGFSNLTYLLRFENRELVLRRPPIGAKIKKADDTSREGGILSHFSPGFKQGSQA